MKLFKTAKTIKKPKMDDAARVAQANQPKAGFAFGKRANGVFPTK